MSAQMAQRSQIRPQLLTSYLDDLLGQCRLLLLVALTQLSIFFVQVFQLPCGEIASVLLVC